jgi:hypothetical protein
MVAAKTNDRATVMPRNLAQPTRGARSDRQPDAAHVLDFEDKITGCGGPSGRERARGTKPGELSADFFQFEFYPQVS